MKNGLAYQGYYTPNGAPGAYDPILPGVDLGYTNTTNITATAFFFPNVPIKWGTAPGPAWLHYKLPAILANYNGTTLNPIPSFWSNANRSNAVTRSMSITANCANPAPKPPKPDKNTCTVMYPGG